MAEKIVKPNIDRRKLLEEQRQLRETLAEATEAIKELKTESKPAVPAPSVPKDSSSVPLKPKVLVKEPTRELPRRPLADLEREQDETLEDVEEPEETPPPPTPFSFKKPKFLDRVKLKQILLGTVLGAAAIWGIKKGEKSDKLEDRTTESGARKSGEKREEKQASKVPAPKAQPPEESAPKASIPEAKPPVLTQEILEPLSENPVSLEKSSLRDDPKIIEIMRKIIGDKVNDPEALHHLEEDYTIRTKNGQLIIENKKLPQETSKEPVRPPEPPATPEAPRSTVTRIPIGTPVQIGATPTQTGEPAPKKVGEFFEKDGMRYRITGTDGHGNYNYTFEPTAPATTQADELKRNIERTIDRGARAGGSSLETADEVNKVYGQNLYRIFNGLRDKADIKMWSDVQKMSVYKLLENRKYKDTAIVDYIHELKEATGLRMPPGTTTREYIMRGLREAQRQGKLDQFK